ncbi:NAD(P)/FAD-dependent oxidoreductase [Undibacterium rugosum]|uniref:FAD-dependent oxidoreductase n=1 Tax=Undibacterium rugosum TaxID=2762291 RepID=A0A923I2S6_9BURK|nr:FAD-dependent oxidoreductase [Undibacterium rugosum]MBC3936631.1 FAD-dependent oxidoreductase [Undibacterium rugosum]MBR7776955.1 FAD-dependent oxidoreductase [Undibacterium rugosum]
MQNLQAVIVGGGHAGAQLCASLRQSGWIGEILMISDEPALPYHRPLLSKDYLSGQAKMTDLLIRSPSFYEKQCITRRFGQVSSIDRQAHQLTLCDGSKVSYDKLALCLGARARKLSIPGAGLAGVHYLRTLSDIEAIRAELDGKRKVVVIGGGYTGLETAASLTNLGLAVTVLETATRVLQRVTAPQVSEFYARLHIENGVQLRTGCVLSAIEGDGRAQGVRCADGELIAADLIIVGIGVLPNTELAEAAGLSVGNGILIDGHGFTNDPNIVAAGDCANYFSTRYGCRLRLESVPNAGELAKVCAAALCGKFDNIDALPWFWSNQFNVKLQIAGLNVGHDTVVIRGDHRIGRSFTCFYLRSGRLIAADCVNRPQDFLLSKKLISEQLQVDVVRLVDESIPLNALMLELI